MKTRKRLSLMLVFCMVFTALSPSTPAKAAWDDNYTQKPDTYIEPVYGLIATQYLTYHEGSLITKDGYPADAEEWNENGPVEDTLYPIDYTDSATVSPKGTHFWFDFRENVDGKRTHVTARDITVKYYGDREPGAEDAQAAERTDMLADTEDGLVSFIPRNGEFGHYALFYKDKPEYFSIYVDYPAIGFYSKPQRSVDSLLLDDLSDNTTNGVNMYYGAKNVVYMNAYGNEDRTLEFPEADSDWGPAFELSLWNDDYEGFFANFTGGKDGIENYLTVEDVSNTSGDVNDHWYKLTFDETMQFQPEDAEDMEVPEDLAAQGYSLHVVMVRTDSWIEDNDGTEERVSGDPYQNDAWFNGQYHSTGLTAIVDDTRYTSNDSIETGTIYPEHFSISFEQTSIGEDGAVQIKSVDTSKLKLERDKNYGISEEEDWQEATPEECTKTITNGTVDCVFHSLGNWRFSFGTEEYIYVHSYLDAIAFWEDAHRPADSEALNKRLTKTTVDEGKSKKIYMLAWTDDENEWAPKTDSFRIKAVADGKEVPSYIRVDTTPTIGKESSSFFGYGIEITNAAKKDFTIVVTAKHNGNFDAAEDYYNEFPVTLNAIKKLEITAPPAKTVYAEGETFSTKGMVVNVVYEDGKKEPVTKYTLSTTKALRASDKSIQISYCGRLVSQAITVNAKRTPAPLAVGKKVEDPKTGSQYKVTGASSKNPTLEYLAPKKDAKKTLQIPDTVTINGTKYNVTSIAANACKNNKKITRIVIGKNITGIGKNAFSGCSKLKSIVIKSTKLSSKGVKKGAFKGISKKTKIQVPKSKLKAYKKLFKKKGLSKKVTVKK